MRVTIRRWGNSLAMRIPKEIAKELHFDENVSVELISEKGRLIVKPSKQPLIDRLIAKIDKDNVHSPIETGEAVGREAW